MTNTFSGSTTLTFDYTYDDVGNRLTMTVDSNDIHEYKYDMLYQLTDVNYPVANDTTYNYDALGNRTSVVNGGTTTYTLNSKGLNQYGTVGGVPYIYDNNGNLTNINNGQYEYAYDCENRLTDVNNTIGQLASYKYDFAGRRVKKITYDPNGQELATIHYVYDGDQVITEYDGEGTLLRYFIYGPGIDEPICMITSTAIYYYHYDGLGSVVALSNSSGNVVETYSYDVYGNPSTTSSVGNPYFFTGRRYDEETSLYYYRARYYSPDIGRFLQTDPIGYIAGLNLYTYVSNNPLNWVDLWGLVPNNLEATNRQGLRRALEKYAQEHRGLTNDQLIDRLASDMQRGDYNLYGVRYFNTNDETTIDLLHFAAAADYGQWYFGGEVVGNVMGWLNEMGQQLRFDESGAPLGGNEDLASNAAGADYGDEYLNNVDNFADDIIDYFKEKYGGITEVTPDYEKECKESGSSSSSSD